jgi:NADPH-dependent glutamate synthase beta subunit-like oxidoreductase
VKSEREISPIDLSFIKGYEAHVKKYLPIYYARPSPCYTEDHLKNPGCPARNDIPRFLFAMSNGDFESAFNVLKLTNPFSGGCGRYCDHPCETACNREKFDSPVDIMALERVAADYGFETGLFPERVPDGTGNKVAVIGGGAAGLTAAFFLKRLGHGVTVFEAERKAGGLMRFGIPRYRYPEDIASYEIEYIERIGVKIELASRLSDSDISELAAGYDVLIIATGALKEKSIGCPGDDLPGIWKGVTFLKEINLSAEMDSGRIRELAERLNTGKRVAVIGGGYTAFDVARSAVRLGSEPTVYYRRTPPQMTAHPGEIEEAEKEGIGFVFLAIPVEVRKNGDGSYALTFQKAKLGPPDESGRDRPVPLEDQYFTVEVDRIITAIGEDSTLESLIPGGKPEGNRLAGGDGNPLITERIFLTGDVRKGYAENIGMIVEAIGSGQDTALEAHSYLTGEARTIIQGREIALYSTIKTRYFEEWARARAHRIPFDERHFNFRETTLPLSKDLAIEMAGRCFFCGICTQCDWCFDYGRGAVAKMMVPWRPDVDAHFFKFIRERVTDKTKEAVWACPRYTMAVVPEDHQWEAFIDDQYI